MEKYYGDANDKFVGSMIYYAKATLGVIYKDAACTMIATNDELDHAFKTGYLMINDLNQEVTTLVRPLCMYTHTAESGTYTDFQAITYSGSTAVYTNDPTGNP